AKRRTVIIVDGNRQSGWLRCARLQRAPGSGRWFAPFSRPNANSTAAGALGRRPGWPTYNGGPLSAWIAHGWCRRGVSADVVPSVAFWPDPAPRPAAVTPRRPPDYPAMTTPGCLPATARTLAVCPGEYLPY